MAIVYFESSAFVKLVVEEDGRDSRLPFGTAAMPHCPAVWLIPRYAMRWPLANVPTGFAPRIGCGPRSPGRVSGRNTRRRVDRCDYAHAGDLAGQLALRGAEAVHLASLLAVGAADVLFAVWDQRLRAGAEAQGRGVGTAGVVGRRREPEEWRKSVWVRSTNRGADQSRGDHDPASARGCGDQSGGTPVRSGSWHL